MELNSVAQVLNNVELEQSIDGVEQLVLNNVEQLELSNGVERELNSVELERSFEWQLLVG